MEQKAEKPELLKLLLRVTGAQTVQRWLGMLLWTPLEKEHSCSYRRNQSLLLAAAPARVFAAAGERGEER